MPDDLTQCSAKLGQLKRDILVLKDNPDAPSSRLLMLVAKKSLQELKWHMREQQGQIRKKLSRSTQASHAAGAYSKVTDLRKKKS
ncbi:hypothetical protein [Cohaesibacter celericrescens]|uniref:hypothetical protein n=1 Tax=Cohaesibacter celericrescens TaxID=2067669 RepID=UPI00356A221F